VQAPERLVFLPTEPHNSPMVNVLVIAVGGAVGSVLRYLASGLAHGVFRSSTFPIAPSS
jgi:hypothetical protein